MNNYNLYLLTHTTHNKTYLGITNNLQRRIRQHNCEIKGGAKYTSSFLLDGKWEYHFIKGIALSSPKRFFKIFNFR